MADSHNERIRVIATSGIVTTLAGNGVAGFAGDGGPALAAELALPRGLMVTATGAVIFADSNNQRLRMVDAGGTITTIAGSGVQGAAADGDLAGTAAMNSPRGVAASSYGALVYADALNHLVRESVANGSVYVPAGLAPTRMSVVILNASSSGGETSATASVAGPEGTPLGVMELLDSGSALTQATLVGGAATFATQTLLVGPHSLSATYLGDGVNPAATSGTVVLNGGTGVITATANSLTVEFGQTIPSLTGSVTGAPTQDGVVVTFTTVATLLSPVGSYPIVATLSGPSSENYTLWMSPTSGILRIVQAASTTIEQPITQGSYTGLPLLLSANVGSTTQGTPTGTVTFLDNGSVVATAMLFNGAAMGTYLAPQAGTHSLTSDYGGDRNFLASVSQAQSATVERMPDFSLTAAGSTTQTVGAGNVANYAVIVGALAGAFTGIVDFSASGLPAGATVAFSPPQVVPGTGSVNVMMSVQTSATLLTAKRSCIQGVVLAAMLCPLWILAIDRRRAQRWLMICGVFIAMLGTTGCGARTVSTALLGGTSYPLTVTGTSTNLAGTVVSHSTQVTLVVE